MSMKFDFRTKLLVIVLTMSLVAVLTSDILIYTLFGVLSVYLIIQGFGRQTIKYLIVCGIFIVLRLLSGGQGITILSRCILETERHRNFVGTKKVPLKVALYCLN